MSYLPDSFKVRSGPGVSVIKKFQITITDPRTKQLAFDLICDLDMVIWNLFVIWCLQFDISGLSGLG
jgi:hypothetical protein